MNPIKESILYTDDVYDPESEELESQEEIEQKDLETFIGLRANKIFASKKLPAKIANKIRKVCENFADTYMGNNASSVVSKLQSALEKTLEDSGLAVNSLGIIDTQYVVFNEPNELDEKQYLISIRVEGFEDQEVVFAAKFLKDSTGSEKYRTGFYYIPNTTRTNIRKRLVF